MPKKERKMKIYYNPEMPDQPFPEPMSYKLLVEVPEELKDINEIEGVKLTGIESGAMNLSAHDSDDLPEGTNHQYLLDGAVEEIKLANQAVSNAKIKVNAIQGAVIAAGAITETKIGDNEISSGKIKASAIIAGKIATGAVIATKIYAGAVTTEKIQANAVTAAKINVSQLSAISANIGSITAGTITGIIVTGGTVRTAASGQRVEMQSAYNRLAFYDSGGSLTGKISGYAGQFYIEASVIAMTGQLQPQSVRNLIPPSNDDYALGMPSSNWKDLYLYNRIYRGSDICFGLKPAEIEFHKNLKPVGSMNIGYNTDRVANIYATNIYCTNQTADQHITGDLSFRYRKKVVFRIDEDPNFLNFYNKNNKKIAKLDKNGNFWIRGEIKRF